MAESTQQKLSRVRPPRVHITYDVETGDAIKTKEIPFVVGILSDLAGKRDGETVQLEVTDEKGNVVKDADGNPVTKEGKKPLSDGGPLPYLKDRKFIEIDRDNFDAVMAYYNPRVGFYAPNTIDKSEEGERPKDIPVSLKFEKMADFLPASIIEQVPRLKQLYEARTRLNDLRAKLDGNGDLEEQLQKLQGDSDLLSKVVEETSKHQAAGNGGDAAGDGAADDSAKEGGETTEGGGE